MSCGVFVSYECNSHESSGKYKLKASPKCTEPWKLYLIYIRTQLFLSRARPEGESKAKNKEKYIELYEKSKFLNDGG